jgi:hypothetical protein
MHTCTFIFDISIEMNQVKVLYKGIYIYIYIYIFMCLYIYIHTYTYIHKAIDICIRVPLFLIYL